jgi:Xaa-Pro aminopeptidase
VSRADRVAARLGEHGADLLLVTDLVNVRYLTGFTGSSAMVVLGPDTRRFITDFRYVERAKAEVEGFDRERAPQEFAEALKTGWPEGELRLGFEDQHMSVRQHRRLRELLPYRIELVPAGGAVEAERALKEPGEVEAIRAAAALADEIYAWVAERGLVGRTEREVARALEEEMRRRGWPGGPPRGSGAPPAPPTRASPRSSRPASTERCRMPSRGTSRSLPACSSPSTLG